MVEATRARLGESETTASPELFVRGTVVAEREAFIVAFLVEDASGADVGERKVRVQGRICSGDRRTGGARAGDDDLRRAPAIRDVAAVASGRRAGRRLGGPGSGERDPTGGRATASFLVATHVDSHGEGAQLADRGTGKAFAASASTLGAAGVASIGIVPKAGFGLALRTTYSPRSILSSGWRRASRPAPTSAPGAVRLDSRC